MKKVVGGSGRYYVEIAPSWWFHPISPLIASPDKLESRWANHIESDFSDTGLTIQPTLSGEPYWAKPVGLLSIRWNL